MVLPRRSRRAEVAAALVCAAGATTVPLLPHHPLARAAGVLAPVLLVLVVALRRRLVWTAAGAGLMAAGDVVFRLLWWAQGSPVVPSVADVAFVLGYLALLRAAQLAAGPGRSGATLDALIVVAGPAAVVGPLFDLALLVLVARRPGEDAASLLARADALLHRAKEGGRDRVCTDASPVPEDDAGAPRPGAPASSSS